MLAPKAGPTKGTISRSRRRLARVVRAAGGGVWPGSFAVIVRARYRARTAAASRSFVGREPAVPAPRGSLLQESTRAADNSDDAPASSADYPPRGPPVVHGRDHVTFA